MDFADFVPYVDQQTLGQFPFEIEFARRCSTCYAAPFVIAFPMERCMHALAPHFI